MTTTKPTLPEHLRADAEGRLRTGTAPASGGWAVGTEALSLLYRLASDPESSADALKLLHELQTHQVELDLQHAQLSENESDLVLQLAHFQAIYDHAPGGYLVLGLDGRIVRSNLKASEFLGLDADQLTDHALTSLLDPASKPAVLAALKAAENGESSETTPVRTLDSRRFWLVSGLAPGQDAVLVLMFPGQDSQES